MIKKRQSLNQASEDREGGRAYGSIGASFTTQTAEPMTRALPTTNAKSYKSNIVSIRFDEGDYERLKEIALEQGTNGAALIRKAVKDIIKSAAAQG